MVHTHVAACSFVSVRGEWFSADNPGLSGGTGSLREHCSYCESVNNYWVSLVLHVFSFSIKSVTGQCPESAVARRETGRRVRNCRNYPQRAWAAYYPCLYLCPCHLRVHLARATAAESQPPSFVRRKSSGSGPARRLAPRSGSR